LKLIELWETYLYQLDTDEDGPPVMPAGVRADPDPSVKQAAAAEAPETEAREQEVEGSLSGTTARESEELGRASEETAHEEGEVAAVGVDEDEA
jgi:sorting nexin-1/2